jgi:tRNA pseudouridine13 synthase
MILTLTTRDRNKLLPRRIRPTMSDPLRSVSDLPFLTDSPGIGGRLRQQPEDFRVEELPLYEASGEGEHAMLLVEKRDLTTPRLVEVLSQSLGVSDREIGVAGRKDRFAVTRQFVTLPARSLDSLDPSQVEEQLQLGELLAAGESIRVLSAKRHGNKLKTAHLAGNRFEIVLRGVADSAAAASTGDPLETARDTCRQIERSGFVNYFGEQRFGHSDNSDEDGFRLLRGEKQGRLNRGALRFTMSAVQSRLFNEWAAKRVEEELAATVLPGDVMQVVKSRGCFLVDPTDLPSEQSRFDTRETVPTGPIFGPKMKMPAGEAAVREKAVLQIAGLTGEEFAKYRKVAAGARRPLLVWPKDLAVKEISESALEFSFTLPSGSYATSLMREIVKKSTET